jgi:acyl-CoA synthetase (AMP-forming)/AMP-acid ligase II
MTYDEAVAKLTAPGAPFEIHEEIVAGRALKNFKNREKNLREKIENAGKRGDQDCLVQGERRLSYGEFARRVFGAGHALREGFGLARGDRLAILAYNSPDWLMTLFGASCVGGIGVGLNGWWATEEIEYGLVDSGSRFLVVDDRLWPRVEGLVGRLESLERIFFIGERPPAGTVPALERVHAADGGGEDGLPDRRLRRRGGDAADRA